MCNATPASGHLAAMVFGKLRLRWLASFVLAGAAVVARGAHADTAELKAQPTALSLSVVSDGNQLAAEDVRLAVQQAVGRPVVLISAPPAASEVAGDRLAVALRTTRGELAVTFVGTRRAAVSRVVAAPANLAEVADTVALLAANLVQDQTDELLDEPPAAVAPVAHPAKTPVLISAPAPAPPVAPYQPVTAAFFFPLATNFDRPQVRTRLSFNLLYGRVGSVDGLQLGLGNQVDGTLAGGQLGVVNLVGGDFRGWALAAVSNVALSDVRGLQLAFFANLSGGSTQGFQGATLLNRSAGPVDGGQVALLNLAGDVRGFQVGVLNIAEKVRGVQVGLINIADDIEGVPVGLISVTRTGGVHPMFWAASDSFANVGLRLATRYTYTLLSGSFHERDGTRLYGPGLALGGRVPVGPVAFDMDVGGAYLFGGPMCCTTRKQELTDDEVLTRLRVALSLGFFSHLRVFAGAAVSLHTRFYQPPDDRTVWTLRLEGFGGVEL